MNHRTQFALTFLLLVLSASTVAADAQSPAEPAKANGRADGKSTRTKPQLVITPEREAAVTEFLRQHHPQLLELVVYLKEHLPNEYQKAMRDLYRTHERLNGIADRGDLQRHELELKLWKTQSRIQLLTAQYRMSKSSEIEKQLQNLLNEQCDQRIMLLRYNRERIESRLQKLDQQIDDLKAAQQQHVQRQMQLLTKTDKPTSPKKNDSPNPRVKTLDSSPPKKKSTD